MNRKMLLVILAVFIGSGILNGCSSTPKTAEPNIQQDEKDDEDKSKTTDEGDQPNTDPVETADIVDIPGTEYCFDGPEMANYDVMNTRRYHDTQDVYYVWTYLSDPYSSAEEGRQAADDEFLMSFNNMGEDLHYVINTEEQVSINGQNFTRFEGTVDGVDTSFDIDWSYFVYGYAYDLDGYCGTIQVIDFRPEPDDSQHDAMKKVIDGMVSSIHKK